MADCTAECIVPRWSGVPISLCATTTTSPEPVYMAHEVSRRSLMLVE